MEIETAYIAQRGKWWYVICPSARGPLLVGVYNTWDDANRELVMLYSD